MSEAVVEDALQPLLDEAVQSQVTPGAAVLVGRGEAILAECYAGALEPGGRAVGPRSLFDLASLTKPLASVGVALRMVADGYLSFESRVGELLPAFTDPDIEPDAERREARGSIRLADLLHHGSGLPAHRCFWESPGVNRSSLLEAAVAEPLECLPGERSIYSDVGFLVLGAALEKVGAAPIDLLFRRLLLDAMDPVELDFPGVGSCLTGLASRVATTGLSPDGALLRGEVHDDNARAMRGIAPHAGLFGSAHGVHQMAAAWTAAWRGEPGVFDPSLVRSTWTTGACTAKPSTWVLGWDTPNAEGSSAGSQIGSPAVGHLGFTGTSLWIDLTRGLHVVLLTNRVHYNAGLDGIRRLRPRLHDAVFAALGN